MKQTKLVTALLVVLMLGGWTAAFLDDESEGEAEYEAHLDKAEDYMERGLYQKAIQEYDSALAVKNSENVWADKLEAYDRRYEEDSEIYNAYLEAAGTAVDMFGENEDYVMILANLYIDREEYPSAYEVLNDAIENGVESEKINRLIMDVKYSYEVGWQSYTGYRTCTEGLYSVCNLEGWIYIEKDGTETEGDPLLMAGPVGESGIRVVLDQERGYLIDTDNVVQGILDFEPVDAGVYSEGLVPISNGKSFSYYNSLGDKKFGDYVRAGTFTDGEAAVQQGTKWFLIDDNGERISDESYDDIILYTDGSHIKNGVMIAKKDGSYKFYKDGKTIGDYSDADIITGDEMVAVCKNGKWGYVDLDGNELIPPTYEEAKSFSNGLAAVSDGELWGFINKDGTLVIDYTFFGADYFNSEKCCMVETGKDTTWQMISLYVK